AATLLIISRIQRNDPVGSLEGPNSHVAELNESGKTRSLPAMRPLKADRTRFFPRRLSRVRRVVDDVGDLRPVQGHLETRALEGDLDMVPIILLAEIGELLVARDEAERSYFSAMQYRCPAVRRKISPLETAGVALLGSPRSFIANSSNFFGSGRKTVVTPPRLVTYNLPAASTTEPQLSPPSSRSVQRTFPVWHSIH